MDLRCLPDDPMWVASQRQAPVYPMTHMPLLICVLRVHRLQVPDHIIVSAAVGVPSYMSLAKPESIGRRVLSHTTAHPVLLIKYNQGARVWNLQHNEMLGL